VNGLLTVDSPVVVRVGRGAGREFASRVEDVDDDVLVVSMPLGASSALLASGSREVDVAWLSPRGRYEQHCRLEPGGTNRQWRLRPLEPAALIQRRRYVRVRASVDVTIDLAGQTITGSTIDVSEGGFRVRLPRCELPQLQHTVVRAALGGADVAISGYVVRSTDSDLDETEAVIAFDAEGADAEAVRRFIMHRQLRARASRDT
jgi:c-di-GMP-binding flagellar brake protein YcgR